MSLGIQPKVLTKESGKMEVQIEVRQLSFEMLKIENAKLLAFNKYCFDLEIEKPTAGKSPEADYNRKMHELDAMGYSLSLEVNELLLMNGYMHSGPDIGPDATRTSTEYLLNIYGLKYPDSWDVVREDQDGQHFSYHFRERVENDYNTFMTAVDNLLSSDKISENEYTRIKAAAEYKSTYHKMLSKYINKEQIEIGSIK